MADVSKFMIDGTTYNVKDATARGSISTIEQKNESQDTKITQLESTVGGHTTSISSIEGEVDTLQTSVSGNTKEISTVKGSVSTLQSTVGGHTTKISTMEGDIAELQANQAYKPTYSNETITLSQAE